MSKHIATLGLGSNLGMREEYLASARECLSSFGRMIAVSPIFATAPVDLLDQPDFLNQVIQIETTESAFELLKGCAVIEAALGRVRQIPKGARTIDIDILFFDDEILRETREGQELIIPHPRLHLRRFVLAPLAMLAPQLVHPVLGKSISEMLRELEDPSAVALWSGSRPTE